MLPEQDEMVRIVNNNHPSMRFNMIDFKIPKFEALQPYEEIDETPRIQEDLSVITPEEKPSAMLTPILVPNELDEMLRTVKSKFN